MRSVNISRYIFCCSFRVCAVAYGKIRGLSRSTRRSASVVECNTGKSVNAFKASIPKYCDRLVLLLSPRPALFTY